MEKSLQNTSNKEQIIAELAKDKVVEDLIKNIGKKNSLTSSSLEDLAQDIYISLLEKPPEVIESLYTTSALTFYIARMVTNNIHSKLSPYYYKYIKPNMIHLEDLKNYDEPNT